VKLLLDEMLPAAVAVQLRTRGHDVVALTEQEHLRSSSDRRVLAIAVTEQRAVVTENLADFRTMTARLVADGQTHPGLILSSSRIFPRGDRRTVGRLVRALEALLNHPPTGESWEHWLQ
jgi:predicted nuclease of predicted toxin-antitoxin system